MKQKIKLMLSICFISVFSNLALADHTAPLGSINALLNDSRNLQYQVSYSTLRYTVKDALARFQYRVEQFGRCVSVGRPTRDHDTIPESCEYSLRDVQREFYVVNRYLYDTYYDYPYIYNTYSRVQRDLQILPQL